MYLLRTFGIELTRAGGVGDEGIDGIGLAPISAVLSSRVAMQAKRYDPTATVGPVELRLISLTGAHQGGKVCVCDLTTAFDLTQPTISHHLKVLRQPESSTAIAAAPGSTTGSCPPPWNAWPRCYPPRPATSRNAANSRHPSGPSNRAPGLAMITRQPTSGPGG